MPLVLVETHVAGPPDQCYALVKDMESYPRFMKAVVSLEVLERNGVEWVSRWGALFQGKLLRWTERDVWDDPSRSMTYRQVQGDLKKFEGEWRCEPDAGGTRITLSVDFDLGVPMLSGLLDPVAKLVTRRNCEAMLAAIKSQVEAAAGARSGGASWS